MRKRKRNQWKRGRVISGKEEEYTVEKRKSNQLKRGREINEKKRNQ